ncbi:MAG: sulfatase-like hydrolase/transferase [Bacillota bacterium]|nr:sulfatase-like hydrolase/transferase [Bacillota bacterium]
MTESPDASPATSRQRPNILLILSDDQGAWALGAAGNDEIITPELDRLAARGVRFTNFFCASPVCSPARASLMTGMIPSAHGVVDWLRGGNVDREAIRHLAGHRHYEGYFASEDRAIGYLDGLETYTDILARNGYDLRLAGKWHLGDSLRPQHGFTGWSTILRGGCNYYGADIVHNGESGWTEEYITDWITDRALENLDELLARPQETRAPWYLSVHYTAPHSPWDYDQHPADIRALYDDCPFNSVPDLPYHPWQVASAPMGRGERRRELLTGYYSAVTAMDRGIGKLFARLEAAGELDRTLIFFLGDNGMNMGHHGIWGKGNGTRPFNLFDTSVKVPAILAWPAGGIPCGEIEDGLWSQYDFIHSLCDFAALEHRLDGRSDLPGRSFAPTLLSAKPATPDDRPLVVFDEYGPARMIRTRRDKYICRHPYGPDEYYDLEADPGEEQNRIADPAAAPRIAALRRELVRWFARYVDPEIDAAKEPVSGSGQYDRPGSRGSRVDVYAPLPPRISEIETEGKA